MKKRNPLPFIGLFFLLGTILGYILSLFVPDQTRDKHQQLAKDKAAALRKIMTDKKQRQRVKKIFQKNTDRALATYQEARETLITNLSQLKGSIDQIDKTKYAKTVNKTITQIKEGKKLPAKQLQELKKYLQEDYQLIVQANQPDQKA